MRSTRWALLWVVGVVAGDPLHAAAAAVDPATPITTSLVSRSADGVLGNSGSGEPSISSSGRYVALESHASNLVPGDANGATDVFVRDRLAGTTVLASISSAGAGANGWSGAPSISANGRFVAFESLASNLVAGDRNGVRDVFVHDLVRGTTVLASVGWPGTGEADGASFTPSISGVGRFVAFVSDASNLVANDRNGVADVFVRDIVANVTRRVSKAWNDAEPNELSFARPAITPDGRYVAFTSRASNLVLDDRDGYDDVFVRDLVLHSTVRASVTWNGVEPDRWSYYPAISDDGRFVAFQSLATNMVPDDHNGRDDIVVRDLVAGTTTRVSLSATGGDPELDCYDASMSHDGRFVAFQSLSGNLVAADTNATWDVFVRDRLLGRTTRVSVGATGRQGGAASAHAAVSGDGRSVAFQSEAANLVAGDTNASLDVFVRGPLQR